MYILGFSAWLAISYTRAARDVLDEELKRAKAGSALARGQSTERDALGEEDACRHCN